MNKRFRTRHIRWYEGIRRGRAWLRRTMRYVAATSGVLFIAWLLASRTLVYNETFGSDLFGLLVFCSVFMTLTYYGFSAARWLKRRLLWRVRRRLAITYLFIGLTPIVLLALIGVFYFFVATGQTMARIVTISINAIERQTAASAQIIGDELARLPVAADDTGRTRRLLDERTASLQATLPGARVAVWRGATNKEMDALGFDGQAQLASVPSGEETRGIGGDTTPVGAPLPGWLRGHKRWSGFVYLPPTTPEDNFDSPSVRAVHRAQAGNEEVVVLVVVPVSRALVEQINANTDMRLRPFMPHLTTSDSDAERNAAPSPSAATPPTTTSERAKVTVVRIGAGGDDEQSPLFKDQFGEPVTGGNRYPVILPTTNWLDGANDGRPVFLLDLSWTDAGKQLMPRFGDGQFARGAKQTLLTVVIAASVGFFLIFELLAVLSAIWMTHAVTGTVHRLYQATQFIKQGDFSHRVHVRSFDQLGELATAFNEMSANVESLLHERVERERLEREVEIAAEVQARLFPDCVPHLATARLSGECRAARGVAGDYYDYVDVAPGLVAFALGDVSGKGISASLVMSNLQASLRAQTTIVAERLRLVERAVAVGAATAGGGGGIGIADDDGCGGDTRHDEDFGEAGYGFGRRMMASVDTKGVVAEMTCNINGQLCRSTDSNRFATLFVALYDDHTRGLRYTNAGHNAAILVRAGGSVERLETGGLMVGAFDFARYEEATTSLRADDLLLLFSDGISEAQNEHEEEYGETRLVEFAQAHRHFNPDEMRAAVFDEVDRWSGATERGDDQTLVILKANRP